MRETPSERRMAENQVVFRENNEKVQKRFDALNAVAAEEGAKPVYLDEDTPLHFYCECSDERCRMRIQVTPKVYRKIHEIRNRFTIVCGHEVPKVEDVIAQTSEYCVVAKHEEPPKSADNFNATDVRNV